MLRYCSSNINSFNITVADNRSEILSWLSPLDPRARHQDIQTRRVENVGDWLLQTDGFRSWCDSSDERGSNNATLFCCGDPGVGKTYISSLVIDKLCDRARGEKTALVCFYIDFAARKEQSPTNILGSLLRQLVSGLDSVPEEVVDAFQAQRMAIGGRVLRITEIVKLFQTITSSQRTIICIDALDECVPEHRLELLDSFRQILRVSPRTRLFLTGRPHIQDQIEKEFAGAVTVVSISSSKNDIINFIRAKLSKDTNPDAMNGCLEADIINEIPVAISEMFLLVSLHTDAILRETTAHRRRQRLSANTDGLRLEDVYGVTLERIRVQGGERLGLGMAALMWICHAERPLLADELCHALAVEIESPNFNAENVPSMGTLLDCCQGLFTVDQKTSVVRLVHFTLQQYLCTLHNDLFNGAHSRMAETCLTYLNSGQVKGLSTNPSVDLQDTPFLKYSSRYWGTHAKIELSSRARSLALELFNQHDGSIFARLLIRQVWSWGPVKYDSSSIFTGLHYASFFGIGELAAASIEIKGYNINQRDFVGLTPLTWAAMYGHLDIVKLLLGRTDIHPDKPDRGSRTALLWAARNGHGGVVELLLGRKDVYPDKLDRGNLTPLSWAARNGHDEVVKLLLSREEVNSNTPDNNSRTPLLWAARNGHECVVKLLLERGDVDPDKPDDNGQTPHSWASRNGHECVVNLLLGWGGVDPDKPDKYNQTPLSWAAENGHEGMVKLLLGRRDVDPNKLDSNSQTPLSWAARNGHGGVVKLLLERGDVDLDKPDENNQTPLLGAARYGHEGVVKLLLGRIDVDPNGQDKLFGRTALSWAAGNGHGGVVKLLLGREGINPNGRDKLFGRTARSWAAGKHEGVARLLPADPSEQYGPPFLPSPLEDFELYYSQEIIDLPYVTQPQAEPPPYNLYANNETNEDFCSQFGQVGTLQDNFYPDHQSNDDSSFYSCASHGGSLDSRQNNRFLTFNILNSPEYSSCHGTAGSSCNRDAGPPRTSTVDSHNLGLSFDPDGSSSNFSHQNYFTGIPQGYTPIQPFPLTSSAPPFGYQSAPLAGAAGSTTDQASSHFFHNPQSYVIQQPDSSLQDQGANSYFFYNPQSYVTQEQQQPDSSLQDQEASSYFYNPQSYVTQEQQQPYSSLQDKEASSYLYDPQSYVAQEQQQPDSSPQDQECSFDLATSNLVPTPVPPPNQPTHPRKRQAATSVHPRKKQDTRATHSSPSSYVCRMCNIGFKRITDLERHLKTARIYLTLHGPRCPEPGCHWHTKGFTRADNFKIHYIRLHGKSSDEANSFIREWQAQTRS